MDASGAHRDGAETVPSRPRTTSPLRPGPSVESRLPTGGPPRRQRHCRRPPWSQIPLCLGSLEASATHQRLVRVRNGHELLRISSRMMAGGRLLGARERIAEARSGPSRGGPPLRLGTLAPREPYGRHPPHGVRRAAGPPGDDPPGMGATEVRDHLQSSTHHGVRADAWTTSPLPRDLGRRDSPHQQDRDGSRPCTPPSGRGPDCLASIAPSCKRSPARDGLTREGPRNTVSGPAESHRHCVSTRLGRPEMGARRQQRALSALAPPFRTACRRWLSRQRPTATRSTRSPSARQRTQA